MKTSNKNKLLLFFLSICCLFSVISCGKSNNKSTEKESFSTEETTEEETVKISLAKGYEDRVVDEKIQTPYMATIKSIDDKR